MASRPLRIALVSPKGPLYRHRTGIFRRSLRYSPLTLVQLVALAPQELDIEWTILDEGIEDVPERLDVDLVGMTVITGTAPRAYELSRRLRAQGVPVVLGGPHVTLAPEDAAPHADSIVVGYAERSWPRLLREFAAGGAQALAPRYDRGPDWDLAGLPHPRRDLLRRRAYTTTNVFEATRGCVHDCSFCVVPAAWGRTPAQRPVEEVVAEIRATGARRMIFIDLNLVADVAYARRLFAALEPLRIGWFGLATSLLVRDEDLLDAAARSGCKGLLIGLESLSGANLREMHKGFNRPEDYAGLVRSLHRRKITLMGCFVFGQDHDEPDVFLDTARQAVDMGIDLPRFAIQTPFPGTALYKRLAAEDRILTRDWSLYDGQHVVYQPARMSVEELQEGHEAAWRHVYSAASMARRFTRSRLQPAVWWAANLGYRHYARNLHRYYTCDWFIGQGAPAVRPTGG